MPVLTIQQIEAPYPGAPLRTIVLQGWAGPVNEVKIGGSQRGQVEWMTSAPTASARLDGPEEDEIPFEFMWKSRLIGGTDAARIIVTGADGRPESAEYAENVKMLVDACHAMRRDTALVSVEWDGDVYVGRIATFSAGLGLYGEYKADLVFEPIQAPNTTRYIGTDTINVERTAEDLAELFNDGVDEGRAEQLPTFRARETNLVDASVERIRDALGEVQGQAGTIGNAARSIEAVQQGVAFAIGGALTAGQVLVEALLAPGEQIAQTDEYAAQIKARVYRATIRQTATRMRRDAAAARRQLVTSGDRIGVHRTVNGETLWSISWRWYGTTRYANLIANRNGLGPSPFVDAGRRLIIPRKPGHV